MPGLVPEWLSQFLHGLDRRIVVARHNRCVHLVAMLSKDTAFQLTGYLDVIDDVVAGFW